MLGRCLADVKTTRHAVDLSISVGQMLLQAVEGVFAKCLTGSAVFVGCYLFFYST